MNGGPRRRRSKEGEGGGGGGGGGGAKRWSLGILGGGPQRASGGRNSANERTAGGGTAQLEMSRKCRAWAQRLTPNFIVQEWEELERTPAPPSTAFHPLPPGKSRYASPLLEVSRFKLKEMPSDFIHASVVEGEKGRRWLVTQGPMAETVADFWQMVWQEKAPAILMLCQHREEGKDKCIPYFRERKGETLRFRIPYAAGPKELSITTESTSSDVGFVNEQVIIISVLKLKMAGKIHTVHHMQYASWPDQSVPSTSEALIPFLERLESAMEEQIKKKRTSEDRPIVVHCSAGRGRSGCLVAAHSLWRQLLWKGGQLPFLLPIVRLQRQQRHGSVQSLAQFFFAYQAILTHLVELRLVPADFPFPRLPSGTPHNPASSNA